MEIRGLKNPKSDIVIAGCILNISNSEQALLFKSAPVAVRMDSKHVDYRCGLSRAL